MTETHKFHRVERRKNFNGLDEEPGVLYIATDEDNPRMDDDRDMGVGYLCPMCGVLMFLPVNRPPDYPGVSWRLEEHQNGKVSIYASVVPHCGMGPGGKNCHYFIKRNKMVLCSDSPTKAEVEAERERRIKEKENAS